MIFHLRNKYEYTLQENAKIASIKLRRLKN